AEGDGRCTVRCGDRGREWERVPAAYGPIADRFDAIDGLGWIVGRGSRRECPGWKDLAANHEQVAAVRPTDECAAVSRYIEGEDSVPSGLHGGLQLCRRPGAGRYASQNKQT